MKRIVISLLINYLILIGCTASASGAQPWSHGALKVTADGNALGNIRMIDARPEK